ncbi:MAG TPA: hypothetical protein VJ438_01455, partial [Candidatus Nanoarchaeia archaeon]|nr:hypothetical protein [Candidatus Nanoarchaeia archaeon]
MKILNILVILGVIAVVTAVGIAINAGITGHSIFGGDSQDSAFDYSKSGLFGGGSPSSGDSSSNNSTDLVNNTEENITIIENETKSSGGGGGGGNSNNVIPDEFCDFIDNDLDGEIDEIGCANVYGTIYNVDTNDTLEGINISFYDSEVYDTFNDTGNYSALVPKEIPDAVTDENGNYNVSILEGIYHMVLQGSKEEDFNIHANASNGALKHDVELNENTASDNFNAEGHILFSGKYEQNNGNKYVCGDKLKFVMFGINHGEENETITFMVEDHTVNHGTNGDSVYNGSILDDDESLTIPAEEKVYKNFEFEIPCGYNLGKYDIHVVWDDSKWHKIGNFFVVGDTTSPGIN